MLPLKAIGLMIISGANLLAMHYLFNILDVHMDTLIFSTTLIFLTIAVIIYSTIDNISLRLKIAQLELDRLNLGYYPSISNNVCGTGYLNIKTESEKKYKRNLSGNAIEKMSNRAKNRKRDENGKFIKL